MSYSSHHDDNISPQPYEPCESTPLYAPTPGYLTETTTPRIYSPCPSHTFIEPRESQSDRLHFIPSTLWNEKKTYNEQPPVYIHYLIEWKVTLNNRTVKRVTEPNLVVAPSTYWEKSLKKKVKSVENRKTFTTTRGARLEDTTIMASVLKDSSQNFHQNFEGTDIDWTMTEEQLLMWEGLFRRGKHLNLMSVLITLQMTAVKLQQGMAKKGTRDQLQTVCLPISAPRLMLKGILVKSFLGGRYMIR